MGGNLCFIVTGLALGFMGGCAFRDDCGLTGTCSCEDPSFGPSHPEVCSCADPYFGDAHRDLCFPGSLDGSASDASRADGPEAAAAALDGGAVDEKVGETIQTADGEGGPAPETGGMAGSAGASGSDAGDGSVPDVKEEPAPPPCDSTKLPSEDACVIDPKYGVFVSALGNDAAIVNSASTPYRTLAKAISVAAGKRVYVCSTAGEYPERVAITGTAVLFGGFECTSATWSYLTTRAAVVRPASGVPLTVAGTAGRVSLNDFEFDAPPTIVRGESSIAALLSSATNVQMTRVKLVAQDAQPGADATVPTPNYDATLVRSDPRITGHNAMNAVGGEAQMCATLCANGVHATGGRGGNGAATAPTSGETGLPPLGGTAPFDGLGGMGGALCANGRPGTDARPQPGGAGAALAGMLTATGWMSGGDGASGTAGTPGQGGGGGGGGRDPTLGGGGGGACGGCGGAPGAGGKTGGSSFALLSVQSSVTLEACRLVAGKGGAGGKGADGQVGQTGGSGGAGPPPGCNGGAGGQGGQSGGGGGGAGGLSVAIGYVGTAPLHDAATLIQTAALPAVGGASGAGGVPAGTKGKDGLALAVQDLTP